MRDANGDCSGRLARFQWLLAMSSILLGHALLAVEQALSPPLHASAGPHLCCTLGPDPLERDGHVHIASLAHRPHDRRLSSAAHRQHTACADGLIHRTGLHVHLHVLGAISGEPRLGLRHSGTSAVALFVAYLQWGVLLASAVQLGIQFPHDVECAQVSHFIVNIAMVMRFELLIEFLK